MKKTIILIFLLPIIGVSHLLGYVLTPLVIAWKIANENAQELYDWIKKDNEQADETK